MLNFPDQPNLPAESGYSEIELAYIEDTPETFPSNQDSNWGFRRKVFCQQLTDVANDLEVIYRNRFVVSALEHLDMWEEQYGLPTGEGTATALRRALILGRMKQGPFTRTRRAKIIEEQIAATFGPLTVLADGLIIGPGVPLYGGEAQLVTALYYVSENVTNFSYNVSVDRTIGVNLTILMRELKRITPAGITITISEDYMGHTRAASAAVGGMTINRSGL